jgi:hypothetical protein
MVYLSNLRVSLYPIKRYSHGADLQTGKMLARSGADSGGSDLAISGPRTTRAELPLTRLFGID